MESKIQLSGIDYVLLPFIHLHYDLSLKKILKRIFGKVFSNVKEAETPAFAKVIVYILLSIIMVSLGLLISVVYFAVYVIVAALTLIPVAVLVAGLGLFYGFGPFVLPTEDAEYKKTPTVKKNFGVHVLLDPAWWYGYVTQSLTNTVYDMGRRPLYKLRDIKEDEEGIILGMSLRVALVISYILYSLIVYITSILISVVGITSILVVSSIIYVFAIIIVSCLPKRKSTQKQKDDNNLNGGSNND